MSTKNEGNSVVQKIQYLSDLELAALICLVADQHCIIETKQEYLDSVHEELILASFKTFGLRCATLHCDKDTTLDDFGNGILVNEDSHTPFQTPAMPSPLDSRRIGNIVLVKNLHHASPEVQVQALELLRGKRNFTRTAVHAAPRPFLFIALNVSSPLRLTSHLRDQFFISHRHQAEDGLPNLEEQKEQEALHEAKPSEDTSDSSAMHTSPWNDVSKSQGVLFTPEDIEHLTKLTEKVKMSPEIRGYLHNIVVFMRLHRAVAGGISALATRHLSTLAHVLAALHGLDYISPALVTLAARKIYPHRIVITAAENERSMQWGSSIDAVKAVLEGITVEDVIEEVLQSVEVPL